MRLRREQDPQPLQTRREGRECSCVDCFAPGGCQWEPGPAPGKGRDDPEWEEPDRCPVDAYWL